jgi:ABC-type glutathione transport system ATPase component
VEVCGVDPEKQAIPHRAQLLFQDAGASLNPGLTVMQILQESAALFGKTGVEEVLTRMDLRHRIHSRPSQLSGGEKRRVTLAQIWLADPPLLVADEPTAGLDASRRAEMIDLLLTRRSPERSFLLISHDLPLVLYACSRIVVMREGRIVDDFPADALWAPERHPWTGQLRRAAGMVPPC